ncbi:Domain of uncharacterised function (DUF2825) [Corynebacterium kutscheri]|nr:Domain of uncharacterised function (DUF2825) [Corynebacterium kutscheri]
MCLRNIPARAGTTCGSRGKIGRYTEHPRASGDNPINAVPPAGTIRNIPARAGTTVNKFSTLNAKRGTSPRERGQPHRVERHTEDGRNIPARAGTTTLRARSKISDTEHPRASGDNRIAPLEISTPRGTSPRERGQLEFKIRRLAGLRNIPARAGTTITRRSIQCIIGEHPRASGDNLVRMANSVSVTGTSPRERGQRSFSE